MENLPQNESESLDKGNKREKVPKIRDYYSPELAKLIEEEILRKKENDIQEQAEKELKTSLENFVGEVANEKTDDEQAKKIAAILKLLPGSAHDIILKYHPEYKGMQVDYVKKVIGEYLGDFMLPKKGWEVSDIEKFRDVIDIQEIREAILYNLKSSCVSIINKEKMHNASVNERDLVEAYFQRPEITSLVTSNIPEVKTAIEELQSYFNELFELRDKKPSNIASSLKEGRVFPDLNQLVNIKEIKDKGKMLIADEMGLGKSASVILAKEYLGLKCALVVMPSNVQETWETYLSDKTDETGRQIGYFEHDLAPKILAINSLRDIERLQTEFFDYILISQEKMGGDNYEEALKEANFDMLIIDEVHKLKNIESGVRSETIINLSEKVQDKDTYLAMLSGTPIPNKVKDIAISLKLLYPEKYKEFSSKEMVNRILYGDMIDLRSELLPRMQMKELASSIEIPPLKETDVEVTLSRAEREIYDILLEEDELTATEKITLFRQFLLNPKLLNVEPGFVGSKIEMLDSILNEDFKNHDKIVVFVNGYIEGVIRGENNIISSLNLPDDIVIEEIHGEVSTEERKRIEHELKTKDQKTVVFVSGQTADVGVDFSGADHVIFYNEPWSKYDKKQEQSRVYREGLQKPLESKTLITKNSIEEGIRQYITTKEKAIEKLLRGIDNTEAEKKLLHSDSKINNANIETNAELSKEYLSDWEKLMVHFGEGFESGEKKFRQELPDKAKEYADLYKKLGRLTYQGNNARVTATFLEHMIEERKEDPKNLRILDVASGPEMLKEASAEKIKDSIFSTDINAEHFTTSSNPEKTITSTYLNMPALDKSIDYINLGFAFHQTSPIKYYKKNYERLQVLAEMNRVLKTGGRAIISMLHNVKFANKETLNNLIENLGFKIVSDYSGEVSGGKSYKSDFLTLEKTSDIPEYKIDALKFASADNARYIAELGDKLGREILEGLEIKKVTKGLSRIRDQRRMIDTVNVSGKDLKVIFNENDSELYAKEIKAINDGEELKVRYGGIKAIPIEEIKKIGFERKLETPGYFLLYKIIEDGGAVIIRGDYKEKKKKSKNTINEQ